MRLTRIGSPSLRLSLMGLLAAVFVPLVLVAVTLLWLQWGQLRDRGMAELQEHARLLRYSLDRELTFDTAVLSGLGASSKFDRADMKGFYDLRRSIRDAVRLHLRVNSGKLSIHSVHFALDELVRRTADEARHTIEHKGLRLICRRRYCTSMHR